MNRRDLFKGAAAGVAAAVVARKAPAEVDIPVLSADPIVTEERHIWMSAPVAYTAMYYYYPSGYWIWR